MTTKNTMAKIEKMARLKAQVRYMDMLQQASNLVAVRQPVQLKLGVN